jgi:2-oxoglutarate dehydrogenase E2 component (dihydrolipoamide succinyltransferase)
MPALGESVTEGTVTRWLKQQGETVEVDEPLLEVSTDKVDTEIPSPVSGVVRQILVNEDETVEVGAPLAIVGGADAPTAPSPLPSAPPAPATAPTPLAESSPAPPAPAPAAPAPPAPALPSAAPAPAAAAAPGQHSSNGSADGGAGYVTPLVRRMATEQGLDLSTIKGTGVGGRIRKQDVIEAAKAKTAAAEAAASAAQAPPARAAAAPASPAPRPVAVSALRGKTEKMSRLRKVIAQRMVESLQTSAQLTTVVEVDVTKIARLRDRAKNDFNAREGVRLTFLPFFALAAVEALKQHPKLNASIEGDDVVYHAEENLGVAVDTERGLLAPVIHGSGDLNIAGLARKITDLAERTRNNKITPDELGGGTFTLTNTGSRGALFDTPILFLPQTAILGTGVVVKRPVVVVDDEGAESIAIRSIVYLALSYDHRLVDGADAARFLMTIKDRLEEGAFEADLGL